MPDLSLTKSTSAENISTFMKENSKAAALWRARGHLLDTKDLSKQEVDCLIQLASICKEIYHADVAPLDVLASKSVANVFFENSTRTRGSFELAAKKLGASVLNLDVETSSVAKGETILDTAKTLVAMGVSGIVLRHSSSGTPHQLAGYVPSNVHVINAGDGWHAHPTQALLDLFTILEKQKDITGAKVAIIGDILHSRVARPNIWLLKLFGANIHVAGPPTLMPAEIAKLGITVHNRLEPAIEDADFIILLRMQLERQKKGLIPSLGEYKKLYRLDHNRVKLAKPGVKIMHPGPVNRGVEITDELVSDDDFTLVGMQVTNGIAVRMAALCLLLNDKEVCR